LRKLQLEFVIRVVLKAKFLTWCTYKVGVRPLTPKTWGRRRPPKITPMVKFVLLPVIIRLGRILDLLYGAKMVFTRSAITSPKVNWFGWNLEHSERIVKGWLWQILGAIRAVATAWEPVDMSSTT